MSGKALKALKTYFGYTSFRPFQQDIVTAALSGEDIFAILPTGSGKSLTFQLPALMSDGLTLVVSPLIALMRDQVAVLKERGLPADTLNSGTPDAEHAAIWRKVVNGDVRLLYVSPEKLSDQGFLAALAALRIDRMVVDEAHCVVRWGHDFREDYLRLGAACRALGRPPVLALTATADEATRAEIAAELFLRPPKPIIASLMRENLFLGFRRARPDPAKTYPELTRFVTVRAGKSGLVYVPTRRRAEEIAEHLQKRGVHAFAYHAGLGQDVRRRRERAFLDRDGVVMAATIAFGMGVDKPNIRFVVHAGLPASIEAYYHEIGRAGRDGASAETLALWTPRDIARARRHGHERAMPERLRLAESARVEAMIALARGFSCRWRRLLHHFGEGAPACGHCDRCVGRMHIAGRPVDVLRPFRRAKG